MCASLLDEAININNTNIEIVHIFGKLHRDEIKQFFWGMPKMVSRVLFAHSVQKRLEIIPIMDVLKEGLKRDGKVELNGKKAIEEYALEAYRRFAKKNSEFKNFIGKLKITGLSVQKNNKFKVTSRYIYAIIRDFTVCEEKRSGGKQSFIISKIGAFGYDYNIRSIKTSSRAKILRKSQVNVTPEVDPIP